MEVKYQRAPDRRDERALLRYMEKNNLERGVITTREKFGHENGIIEIPAYAFLLLQNRVKTLLKDDWSSIFSFS